MQNEIQVNRFSLLLSKLLEMGNAAPAPTLATDVFSTISMEPGPPEFAYLKGDRLMCGGNILAGVAGEYGRVYLGNPLGSNILVILESVSLRLSTAGFVRIYANAAAVTPTGATRWTTISSRDSRWSPTGTAWGGSPGAGYIAYDTDAAFPLSVQCGYEYVSTSRTVFSQPWVLNPGRFIVVVPETVNISVGVNWYWRERLLARSEAR